MYIVYFVLGHILAETVLILFLNILTFPLTQKHKYELHFNKINFLAKLMIFQQVLVTDHS